MLAYEHSLRQLHGQKLLQPLDLHFALFLMSQAAEAGELAALTFALVSRATSEGHVCLDLRSLRGQTLLPAAPSPIRAPSVEAWRELLLASGVVGRPGEWQPLILDAGDRLYLHRYWAYERALGLSMLKRSHGLMEGIDDGRLRSGLDLLFEPPPEGEVDWQRIASATAVLRRLSIISGGPGTGKTSTVVRILALLREQPGGTDLRIALAAPTGMAASRLQQSIHHAKSRLPLTPDALQAIPEQAMTLHRLLGVRRQGTGFRHQRDNPLPLDVLVLDEASMVDVALMAKLLDALPKQARLILLGDRDQLASVEAGAVLGDLCAGCEGPDLHFVERLRQVTDLQLSDAPVNRGSLHNSVVVLRRSYRFDSASPIGRLAAAVNQGDAPKAESLLRRAPADAGIGWLEVEPSLANLAAERYADLLRQVSEGVPVGQLFDSLQGYRVLCALRGGPFGAERLNLAITRRLQSMGLVSWEGDWFPGRPVMVTRNDYQLGLYNGDTGIVLPHPDHPRQLAVAFATGDGQPRWIAPARLPGCETVFAVTVHKSQGSEFAQVALQLPDQLSPVLCRELIYTAITRARDGFFLAGSAEVFRAAVSRRLSRHSGLVDLLDSESDTSVLTDSL
jgi:exodeoxyribonuclease V alpha subunit